MTGKYMRISGKLLIKQAGQLLFDILSHPNKDFLLLSLLLDQNRNIELMITVLDYINRLAKNAADQKNRIDGFGIYLSIYLNICSRDIHCYCRLYGKLSGYKSRND